MATRAGRQHAMLLFTVLAGLFLMHGICAPSMHGMPVSEVMPMPVSGAMSISASSPMPVASSDAPTILSGAEPTADHMAGGESCIPLRPEGMSGLFLALFLIVITLWRPKLPDGLRLIRPHWPHGPPGPASTSCAR